LEEALKFVRPLTTLFNRNVEAHVVAFEVYSRLGKVLPMLQCLVSGHRLAADDASLHICKIKFLIYREFCDG
jgi:peptide alpha-N-acetyltransferase